MVDSDRDELRKVARRKPDGQAPLVERLGVDVADPHEEHLHAVLVGIEASQRLAEDLGYAIASVGPRVDAMVDGLVAPVEAHRMVAGGEDDALHLVPARGLEYVVAADDVRLVDRLPRAFHRVPAEVHDGIDAFRDLERVGQPRDIRPDEFLAFGGLQRAPVGKNQTILPRQLAPQIRAYVAGRAGDQYFLHDLLV